MNAGTQKVLVIDDDNVVLSSVERILSQKNYIAICADNGKTGIEKAILEQPDAIVLDHRMPEMSGHETLIELKASEVTKHIPVIMLTADKGMKDISDSFDLGALDYIVKPFDPENFLIRLKKVL